jgi:hypothetical protein
VRARPLRRADRRAARPAGRPRRRRRHLDRLVEAEINFGYASQAHPVAKLAAKALARFSAWPSSSALFAHRRPLRPRARRRRPEAFERGSLAPTGGWLAGRPGVVAGLSGVLAAVRTLRAARAGRSRTASRASPRATTSSVSRPPGEPAVAAVAAGQTDHVSRRVDVGIAELVREAIDRCLETRDLTRRRRCARAREHGDVRGINLVEHWLADALGVAGKPLWKLNNGGTVGRAPPSPPTT